MLDASRPLAAALALLGLAACDAPSAPPQRAVTGISTAPRPGTLVAPAPPLPGPELSASATATLDPDAGAGFHCFSWVHQADFSTDCYRTESECLEEATRMEQGARLPTACASRPQASCTTLRGTQERCFGNTTSCVRYRAFVGRNHLETTPCVPR